MVFVDYDVKLDFYFKSNGKFIKGFRVELEYDYNLDLKNFFLVFG